MKQYFWMQANLMWMINDFTTYSIMSSWSMFNYLACPSCAENTVTELLYKSKKIYYIDHERFREDPPPPSPTGLDVLSSVGSLNVMFALNYKNPTDTR